MLKKILLLISIIIASLSLQGCISLGASVISYSPKPISASEIGSWPEYQPGISVQTYNVKHLECPLSCGRSKVAVDIGYRFSEMRKQGIQPNIVLLQEAFRKGAENINRYAKYPYIVYGPDKTPKHDTYPISEEFYRKRLWIKGESSKPLFNSGLAILSDYPIISVKRVAFPRGMCAGYDCLASKGILIAWIQVPEIEHPVAFVVTHLNSRKSSYVSKERSDEAYHHQIKMLHQVLHKEIAPKTTIVVGGDFNIVNAEKRLNSFEKYIESLGYQNSIREAYEAGDVHNPSIMHIQNVLKDNYNFILVKNTPEQKLKANNAWVPFPKYISEPLSDHSGIILNLSVVEDENNKDIVPTLE